MDDGLSPDSLVEKPMGGGKKITGKKSTVADAVSTGLRQSVRKAVGLPVVSSSAFFTDKEASRVVVEMAICPVCEARRLATKLAVKKHRTKKKGLV
tara:strand:+ start:431 stop:718 length:288 start_codon:yes stop_codon:yes gene_type:complete